MSNPIRRRRLGAPVVLDPRSIPGLKLWLKADAIPGLADGAGIASWPDSSGNAISTTQATGVNQPTYKVNIVNGLPVARGITSTGFLTTLADSTLSHSFFTACNPTGTTGYLMDSSAGRLIVSPLQGSAVSKIAYFDGVTWKELGASVTGVWQICSWVLDNAANLGQIWRNGVSIGTSTYSGKAIGGATGIMDFNNGPSVGFIGDVAELLIYAGALSTAQRQSIEQYLNLRYRIF